MPNRPLKLSPSAVAIIAVALVMFLTSPTSAANAASSRLTLPIPLGQSWFICQGYNTSEIDHIGSMVDALDLALGPASAQGTYGCMGPNNASQGKNVTAPAAGTVVSQCCGSPVNDMVCLALDAGGSVQIGHMTNMVAIGTHLSGGGRIGLVAPAGTTTNQGGFAHVHVAAYGSSNCAGTSLPFSDASGDRFSCAPDLPADGSAHQYYRRYLSRCGTTASSVTGALLRVEVTLPGISAIGVDNNAPRHPQRAATVDIQNSTRQVVLSKTQNLNYDSVNGDFVANINLGAGLAAGQYFVRILTSGALAQTFGQYSGTRYSVANLKKTYLPRTPLFTGDVNGDGVIDILDYNILLNCWQQTGCAPGSTQYNAADLNDNGVVDGVDYNIWLSSNGASSKQCSNGICVYNQVW